jgi:hypothetical protein
MDESITELGSFDYSFQLEEKTYRHDFDNKKGARQ